MKRNSWLFAFVLVLVIGGLAFWSISYMARRAVLSRELSLFNRVHTAVMTYQRDTGHFPVALETPTLQRYFTDFREQDWAFLRQQELTYTAPPRSAAGNFTILRASTPWGVVTGHADGNKTYWQHSAVPYWRYQSLTVPNASPADLEQSMRSALGTDHAEFTYLGPHQLGIKSFGSSPSEAMNLSGRLEAFAATDLEQRGIGPVTTREDDSSSYSDGDPDDFPLWRVHHFLRSYGFPGWHFDEDGFDW